MLKRKPSKAEQRLERELDAWQELRTKPLTRTTAEIEYIDRHILRLQRQLQADRLGIRPEDVGTVIPFPHPRLEMEGGDA